jgi:hypothetical protein
MSTKHDAKLEVTFMRAEKAVSVINDESLRRIAFEKLVVHLLNEPDDEEQITGSGANSGIQDRARSESKRKPSKKEVDASGPKQGAPLHEIANAVKSCEAAEDIEKNVLDRTSQVNRTLLPLYVLKKFMKSDQGLTSGEVASVTKELGVPIAPPNVSNTLSGTAAKYVMGDATRKKGQAVRYRLNRRGERYMAEVIGGSNAKL